jgi:hypothetical protein
MRRRRGLPGADIRDEIPSLGGDSRSHSAREGPPLGSGGAPSPRITADPAGFPSTLRSGTDVVSTGWIAISEGSAFFGRRLPVVSTGPLSIVEGFGAREARLARELLPRLHAMVTEWPELRGVRAFIRAYRFASLEEGELDLYRFELRVPGVATDVRFRLWDRLRTSLDLCLTEIDSEGHIPGFSRPDLRRAAESMSTAVVG